MDSSGSLSERRGWRSCRSTGNGRGRVLRHRVERDPHRDVHARRSRCSRSRSRCSRPRSRRSRWRSQRSRRRSRRSHPGDPGVHIPAISAFTSAIRAFTSRRSERSREREIRTRVGLGAGVHDFEGVEAQRVDRGAHRGRDARRVGPLDLDDRKLPKEPPNPLEVPRARDHQGQRYLEYSVRRAEYSRYTIPDALRAYDLASLHVCAAPPWRAPIDDDRRARDASSIRVADTAREAERTRRDRPHDRSLLPRSAGRASARRGPPPDRPRGRRHRRPRRRDEPDVAVTLVARDAAEVRLMTSPSLSRTCRK